LGAKKEIPSISNDVMPAANKTGNATLGTGIEESTQGQGATDEQGGTGMTGQMKGAPSSSKN
jgi:hypothetical protein